jgi:2-oxoisovalerate dehydrogenase E1 component
MDFTFDIKRVPTPDTDYGKYDRGSLVNMVFQIFLIREFEKKLLALQAADCVHGPIHTSIGQEACAAGAMAALEITDKIFSTHRAHHHYLVKALNFYSFDPLVEVPQAVVKEITCLLGEVMGLSIGCCGGRGGSMHLRNERIGVTGTDALVAGGIPLATGAAYALKYKGETGIIVSFLGDGAVNQGAFHEALNLAGLWKLPVIYFLENNAYAVATAAQASTATGDLAVKAAAYGIRGRIVDGMDPVGVMEAVREAKGYAREGKGPTLIEAKCYRFLHHAGPLEGSSFGYRPKEEENSWAAKDPYGVFPQKLLAQKILTQDQIDRLKQKAVQAINEAENFCTVRKDEKISVRDDLWPDPASLMVGLRSDGAEYAGIKYSEPENFSEFEEMTYVQAIAAVTERHLAKDPTVLTFGEEVANFGGGPYGATKGLPDKFPGRVFNTPISECGFVGLGGGMAMSGLKPVVEIMFPDFALVAADQLFNQVGKLRHIYGNTTDMPLVVRTRVAIGCGYGGQHSMDPAGLFALFSGWRMVAPSNAFDYVGLFNSAMRSRDPVLIVEHHSLYGQKFPLPKANLDFFVPFGKARVITKGDDVTVLCYSSLVKLACQAAEELKPEGIGVEVVDLRTISPTDIDYSTIGQSLRKTSVLVILEQAAQSHSIGARIADECQRRFFDWLDSPIITLAGTDVPNPVSKILECSAVPDLVKVKEIICQAAKRTI